MSKEPSELALKIGNKIADQFTTGFCNDRMVEDFARIVDEHLQKREPLSDEKIYMGFQSSEIPHISLRSFVIGVKFAEREHGIGVGDE